MSYATKQAMIDRYSQDELIQLTDRATPPAGVINDTVLNAAIADADAEINGYLQARYALPLASTPLIISKLACEVTRYFLYDDTPTEPVEERYKHAIKTLADISRGSVKLGLDALDKPTPTDNLIKTSGPNRTFDRGSMRDY